MRHPAFTRALVRTAAAAAVGLAAAAAIGTPASAHVSVSADQAVAGEYSILSFSVPHGCDGEATTAIAIQIPEPINAVTPTVNPNWHLEPVYTDLPEPVTDSHGNEVTERVSEILYHAEEALPEGQRDVFELSLRLPEEAAGQTLAFPVIQTCGDAEHPWIQVAEDGQDPDELDSPAPSVEVAAEGTAEGADAAAAADTGSESEATADDSTDPLVWTALAVGAVGVVLGVVGLLRGRRSA